MLIPVSTVLALWLARRVRSVRPLLPVLGAVAVTYLSVGAMKVLLPGEAEWRVYGEGESYNVPASSSFKLIIEGVADYCCSYE